VILRSSCILCLSAMFLLFISGGAHRQPSGPAGSSAQSGENMSTVDTPLAAKYKGLPLGFERNEGQTDTRVKFLSRGHGYTVFLMGDEAVLELRTLGRAPSTRDAQQFTTAAPKFGIVHMKLVKASASAGITGFDQLPGRSNYFIGNDPAKWHSGVPNFAKVKYHGVYPGIDLVYYGNQGQLEYDFVVAPGANPDAIRLEFSGNDLEMGQTRLPRLDSTGALVAETSAGEVRLHKPVIYQKMNDGKTKPIDGHYRLLGDDQVAFEISPYDRSRDLVIDPVLTYASYLGGTDADARDSVSVTFDSVGNAYVASGTMSTDFPVSAGTFQGGFAGGPAICDQGNNFCGDAFVTKINPSGTAIVYSTYLGGSDSDYAFGLAVDSAGNAYVTGLTKSTNFPVTPGAFQPVFGGAPVCDEYVCGDTFVTKLNPTGSALVYSSYLGGSGNEHAEAIAVDAGGNAYVAGDTGSANFPITPGAFQTQFTGSNTCFGRSGANLPCHVAFLSKVNPSGTQLVYSTYLGGSSGDGASGLVVDSGGHASIAGGACSSDFPVTPSGFQTVAQGGCDIFVTTFNATGSKLLYSTYFGGTNYENSFSTAGDSAGNVYISGLTYSPDLPVTVGAAQSVYGGNGDALVAKFNPRLAGSASLVYSTYLGGSQADIAGGAAVDSQGNAYVSGQTMSNDFPVVNPLQAALNGKADAFVAKLNPQGTAFVYSTYLGGSGSELADFVSVDVSGNAYVAGWTQSADFPSTPRAFQPNYGGGTTDVFITKISPNSGSGVSFTPSSLTFSPQAVGTTSPAQTVVVHDAGSAALRIASIASNGNFAQTNNCGSSVAGGGSCAISITFTPTSLGLNSGGVGVTDNAGGSPQRIKLSGTGK